MRFRFIVIALVCIATPLAAQHISTRASQPSTTLPGVNPDPFVFPNQPPNQPTVLFRPNFTVPSSFDDFQRGGRVHVDGHVRFDGGFRHHRRFRNSFGVVVPYASPYYVMPNESETPEQPVNETPQYSGNELDRQMLLQHIANSEKESSANDSRYGEHYLDSREPRTTVTPEPPAAPREEEMLMLVFRDGHQLLVANYAIVGDTFYDLTPGHKRMIKLSDLDLVKTKQLNDDRGVDFAPPKSS